MVVQSPNFFGALERIREIADVAHKPGALLIVTITEPLSLADRQASQRGGHRLRRGAIVRRAAWLSADPTWVPDPQGKVP